MGGACIAIFFVISDRGVDITALCSSLDSFWHEDPQRLLVPTLPAWSVEIGNMGGGSLDKS